MASDLRVFDFVLERETMVVLPGESPCLKPGPAADPAHATDRLIRPGAAGRRLVEDHLRLLVNRHRRPGRDAA